MKRIVSLGIVFILLLIGAIVLLALSDTADAPDLQKADADLPPGAQVHETSGRDQSEPNRSVSEPAFSIDEVSSIWLVVNRQRPISKTYVPADLVDVAVLKRADKSSEELQLRNETAKSLEAMFAAANKVGVELLMGSAYRSADLQAFYYNSYVANYSQVEADKFSAKPGTSEHQTGLAVDVSSSDLNCYLEICFAQTAAGKWVAQNAHKFGFIIRYPHGKESITGYQYEPWHLRYVGEILATRLHSENVTMEEYFNLVQ